jgi:hypothetical protein
MSITCALALLALGQPIQSQDRTVIREWTYYPNFNSIETIAGGVHAWHSFVGSTDGHAYGTLRLDFPLDTLSWEIQFRLRFGELGTVPARLELRAGGTRFLLFAADASTGKATAALAERVVYSDDAGDDWRNVRIIGSAEGIELTVNGRSAGSVPETGVPDLLVFGGVKGLVGRQTEAWLKLDSIQYRLLTESAKPSAPIGRGSSSLSIELVSLKQAMSGSGEAAKAWRWIAGAKVTNFGKSDVDLAAMPSIKLVTEDYREHMLLPLRWDESLQMHVVRTPGESLLRPGESQVVEFVSGAPSPIPSAKPVRAEWTGPSGAAQLKLPPP